MPRKRHTPEQVINKLREAEVAISGGGTVAEASRQIGVTEQTFYRWRNEYGGSSRVIPIKSLVVGRMLRLYRRACYGTQCMIRPHSR